MCMYMYNREWIFVVLNEYYLSTHLENQHGWVVTLLQGTLHQTCACQLLVWTRCIQWRSNNFPQCDVGCG